MDLKNEQDLNLYSLVNYVLLNLLDNLNLREI